MQDVFEGKQVFHGVQRLAPEEGLQKIIFMVNTLFGEVSVYFDVRRINHGQLTKRFCKQHKLMPVFVPM